jgi:hypothetical protein
VSHIDLRTLALRLKIVEMLRLYSERRQAAEPSASWRRLVCPN